jgi:predicted phage-related endonuclease
MQDWMAVSKVADKKTGEHRPLKPRLDLEREIAFEKTFKVGFSKFVTGAMQEGIDNEDFVRNEYASSQGVIVRQAGCFYDSFSIASPDGLVGDDGGIEIKWLQDSNWTLVATSGKPLDEHYYQIQSNLRLSGRTWWDYIAANGNTGRYVIIRVERDEELISQIGESVKDVALIHKLEPENMYTFSGSVPTIEISEEFN